MKHRIPRPHRPPAFWRDRPAHAPAAQSLHGLRSHFSASLDWLGPNSQAAIIPDFAGYWTSFYPAAGQLGAAIGQSSSPHRPFLRSTGLNGRPGYEFDASTSMLAYSPSLMPMALGDWTIAWVASLGQPTADWCFVGFGASSADMGFAVSGKPGSPGLIACQIGAAVGNLGPVPSLPTACALARVGSVVALHQTVPGNRHLSRESAILAGPIPAPSKTLGLNRYGDSGSGKFAPTLGELAFFERALATSEIEFLLNDWREQYGL